MLSSPAVRCGETVAPFAAAHGLAVGDGPHLAEGTSGRALLGWLATLRADTVVCSHGDVIGDLVVTLDGRGVLRDPAAWSKASTWVLDLAGGEVVAAWHLAPPAR